MIRASAMMVRSLKKIKVCNSTDALPAIWALRCLVFRLSVSACTPARSLADSGRGARPSEAASRRCTNTSAYLQHNGESGHVLPLHNHSNNKNGNNFLHYHSDDDDDTLACRLMMG